MPTQQDLNDLFQMKMNGFVPYDEYDLQTIKLDFINQPFSYATASEKNLIQTVRYALWNQDGIVFDDDTVWKCYLEYSFLTNNITTEKLYSKIFHSYSKLPKRGVKPAPAPAPKPTTKLSEMEEFEQACKNKDADVKKKYHALAQKYRDNQDKLKEVNNIKNIYW